jgi:mevalonate kinase
VLGDTGLPSPAAQMRDKVKRFHDTNSFARDIVRDLIGTVPEADEALRKRDMEGLGRIMSENQKLLVTLGVSHPTLDKLISAASRHSYGAKLVGPGGGGCIAALTDEPERTVEAINRAGGRGLMLPVSREGLRLENPEDRNNENGSGKDPDPR